MLEATREGITEIAQMTRLASMTIEREMHSSFVIGDSLVNISEISRELKAACKRIAEIIEITRLARMVIGNEMYSSLVIGDGLVTIN